MKTFKIFIILSLSLAISCGTLQPEKYETNIEVSKPTNIAQTENVAVLEEDTVVFNIKENREIFVEGEKLGTIEDLELFEEKIKKIFDERKSSARSKTSNAVTVKIPKSVKYGDVTKVIDVLKKAGAEPIALQITDLSK